MPSQNTFSQTLRRLSTGEKAETAELGQGHSTQKALRAALMLAPLPLAPAAAHAKAHQQGRPRSVSTVTFCSQD